MGCAPRSRPSKLVACHRCPAHSVGQVGDLMNKQCAHWRKSRHSETGGNCVEVGRVAATTIGVRDSTLHTNSTVLEFTRTEWAAFLRTIRSRS
ncbi:DUF397 domain-containing protein [Actinomadura meridiana]|uniref:DUF397 domain-containing protein n=1 Tax=Actinomadura meridiana TaxID=559626 RepID=UPI0031EC1D04